MVAWSWTVSHQVSRLCRDGWRQQVSRSGHVFDYDARIAGMCLMWRAMVRE